MSLLEFRAVGLDKSGVRILDGVSFRAEPGDGLVAFGLSGSGKHELLQLAAGVLGPTRGEITLSDARPGSRLPVGYALLEGGLISNLSLVENVMLPAVYHRCLSVRDARPKALELLELLGVGLKARLLPALAGHADRRLAQLARALLASPSLFVLDDPLEDLDAGAVRRVMGVLKDIRGGGQAAVLVATGNPRPYLDWAKRFLWVRRGGVEVFEGREGLRASTDPDLKVFTGEA